MSLKGRCIPLYSEAYVNYQSCSIVSHAEQVGKMIMDYANFVLIKWDGHRSPEVGCWTSDHWVAGSNPLSGACFIINFTSLSLVLCLAQFSLNNVQKGGLKQHHFIFAHL